MEIEENSELDLFEAFHAHKDDKRIPALVAEMEGELGEGNCYPGILPKLAQYEITLLDWYESHLGASEFGVFANKCWPAFQTQFGFVPCYVNCRLRRARHSRRLRNGYLRRAHRVYSRMRVRCARNAPRYQ